MWPERGLELGSLPRSGLGKTEYLRAETIVKDLPEDDRDREGAGRRKVDEAVDDLKWSCRGER